MSSESVIDQKLGANRIFIVLKFESINIIIMKNTQKKKTKNKNELSGEKLKWRCGGVRTVRAAGRGRTGARQGRLTVDDDSARRPGHRRRQGRRQWR